MCENLSCLDGREGKRKTRYSDNPINFMGEAPGAGGTTPHTAGIGRQIKHTAQ